MIQEICWVLPSVIPFFLITHIDEYMKVILGSTLLQAV